MFSLSLLKLRAACARLVAGLMSPQNFKGKAGQGRNQMSSMESQLRDAYLELMRNVIINEIYKDPPVRRSLGGKMAAALGFRAGHNAFREFDPERRDKGLDWPSVAHSMIGKKRMDNLRVTLSDVIEQGVPGDFVETGVWRGGACIFARAIMKAYGETGRKVWVADSFAGLPEPDADKYEADKGDTHHTVDVLAVSVDQVKDNFRVYGLLDDQVEFLVGWFKDTLPEAPIDQVAVLRLDGDMYESTWDAMQALYAKVSPNGYVIVDDYHAVPGCKKAVHDFLEQHHAGEQADIQEIDGTGVYWQRRL